MYTIRKKGLKPHFIKYMALFIGLCYLANPFHNEIGLIFHELSHLVTPPSEILSHTSIADQKNSVHYEHEHNMLLEKHDHSVLDFIASMFSTSETDSSDQEALPSYEQFDKHLTVNTYTIQKRTSVYSRLNFKGSSAKVTAGHFSIIEQPPQNN